MNREEVPAVVARLMSRPARWAPVALMTCDYDGRDRTLEVFETDPSEQLALLNLLGEETERAIEAAAGGPIVIIFHTRKESAARYADFVGIVGHEIP